MRSADQISSRPDEWAEQQAEERRRHVRVFLAMTARARFNREPWIVWLEGGRPAETPEQYAARGGVHAKRKRRG